MNIPIFVSCPTSLSGTQEKSRLLVCECLADYELEARALGRSDYAINLPLREVYTIAKHCSGGIILGFSQFETDSGIWKKGTPEEKAQLGKLVFATPWNQLEAAILISISLPLLIFREPGIHGGVFDPGVTDVFIHPMPLAPLRKTDRDAMRQVFLKWSAKVREHYYKP